MKICRNHFIKLVIFILPFLGLTLIGCSSTAVVKNLAQTDIGQVQSGQQTIVLLQIKTNIDGKSVNVLDPVEQPSIFYLANMDNREIPQKISNLYAATEELGAQGWIYMLLEPGSYYLLTLPPGIEQNPPAIAYHIETAKFGRFTQYEFEPGRGGFWYLPIKGYVLPGALPADFEIIPGFWFHVSEAHPLQYIGSLSVNCSGGRGLFGSLIGECSDIKITSTTDSTLKMVSSAFTGQGKVHSSLMTRYGELRAKIPIHELEAVGIVVLPLKKLGSTEFKTKDIGAFGGMHGVGQGVAVYNLLTMLVESGSAAMAKSTAENNSSEWQSCMEELIREIQPIQFSEYVERTLQNEFSKQGGSKITFLDDTNITEGQELPELNMQFEFEFTKINLRECIQTGDFCPEVAIRIRAKDPSLNLYVYDSVHVYTNIFTMQDPLLHWDRLYQIQTTKSPRCKPLKTWCNNGGHETLQKEILRAVEVILEDFSRTINTSK